MKMSIIIQTNTVWNKCVKITIKITGEIISILT